jgi:hypothetical protein
MHPETDVRPPPHQSAALEDSSIITSAADEDICRMNTDVIISAQKKMARDQMTMNGILDGNLKKKELKCYMETQNQNDLVTLNVSSSISWTNMCNVCSSHFQQFSGML